MNSVAIPLAVLRVVAVAMFVLGISSMHSPDPAHSVPMAEPAMSQAGSMAMTDAPPVDPPMHEEGGSSPHHRWVSVCLAVLGTLGAALALCWAAPRANPMGRARRHRSTAIHRATQAWSPAPCIHRLCVMRV